MILYSWEVRRNPFLGKTSIPIPTWDAGRGGRWKWEKSRPLAPPPWICDWRFHDKDCKTSLSVLLRISRFCLHTLSLAVRDFSSGIIWGCSIEFEIEAWMIFLRVPVLWFHKYDGIALLVGSSLMNSSQREELLNIISAFESTLTFFLSRVRCCSTLVFFPLLSRYTACFRKQLGGYFSYLISFNYTRTFVEGKHHHCWKGIIDSIFHVQNSVDCLRLNHAIFKFEIISFIFLFPG